MRLLIDTNLVVDWLRGHQGAVSFLRALYDQPFVSAMTVAELYRGVRDGREREQLIEVLQTYSIVSVDEKIAERGGLWVRQYAASHGVGLTDALIAACAESAEAQLATRNRKHFPMFADLVVPY